MENPFEAAGPAGTENPRNMLPMRPRHNHFLGGLVIIIVGLAMLLRQLPQTAGMFPGWLFTWPMILVIIGIFVSIKHRNFSGVVPFMLGLFFLLQSEHLLNAELRPYAIPVLIILIGIFFIFMRHHGHPARYHQRRLRAAGRRYYARKHCDPRSADARRPKFTDNSGEDYIDVNSVFGSAEKNMFTKKFKGGHITCAFGSGKINLTQADIEDTAVLNISVNFGGAEIMVPSNWNVQNELNALFGGIEDKRRTAVPVENAKTLILRGNIFCGGVELMN